MFSEIPGWIRAESPNTKELWAPDISYFDGKFHLYYAYSLFGRNTSAIALLTNKTLNPESPDYRWVDEGLILRSGVHLILVRMRGGDFVDFKYTLSHPSFLGNCSSSWYTSNREGWWRESICLEIPSKQKRSIVAGAPRTGFQREQ